VNITAFVYVRKEKKIFDGVENVSCEVATEWSLGEERWVTFRKVFVDVKKVAKT